MAKKEILNNDALTLRVDEDGPIEAALDSAERTLDVLEGKIETLEHITEKVVTVTKNNPWIIAGAFLVGVGLGGFVAYKIANKRLGAKFDAELDEQMAATREWRHRIAKEGEFETPESAVKALVPDEVVEAVRTYQGREKPIPYNKPDEIVDPRPPVDVVVEEVQVTQNVFVERDKNNSDNESRDWDYNAEIADRELHPDIPYAISFEEFNENAPGHEQTTLTYFALDDTLVDAQDKPIDNTEYTVGDDNLNRFGHGSGDPNVVYVRNEKIDMDFEVVRDKGSYSKAIFGNDPDPSLQHARRRSNRRSWRDDE